MTGTAASTTRGTPDAWVQTKHLQKRACFVEYVDDGFAIHSNNLVAYRVRWRDVDAVNVQPMFSKPSLVVFDCIPEGQGVPMLIKLWLGDLADVAALKEKILDYDAKVVKARDEGEGDSAGNVIDVTGRSVLWSGCYSPVMLPMYFRGINQIYKSISFLLKMVLVCVTAFMVLDVLGMHTPGLADYPDFTARAGEILDAYNGSLPALQHEMTRLVGALSHADQTLIAQKWEPYGWGHTFLDADAIVQHKEDALYALRDSDYLAGPMKMFLRWSFDALSLMGSYETITLLAAHPYLFLLLPIAVPVGMLFTTVVLWVFVACTVILSLKELATLFLSFKLTLLAKQMVMDAQHMLSSMKWCLRTGVGCVQLAKRLGCRFWALVSGRPAPAPGGAGEKNKKE